MKITMLAVVLLVLGGLTGSAFAGATYTFNPTPVDLQDLPHAYYFTWGIDLNLSQGETITGATLTYYNIYDWKVEDDRLYTDLLDNTLTGTRAIKDNQGGGDNNAGKGVVVGEWNDPLGGSSRNFNLVYDFGDLGLLADLNTYASTSYGTRESNFGFGIDPDCHYYNNRVEFVVTTDSAPSNPTVPVPGAIVLGGIGTCFVGWLRRRNTL